MYAKPAQNFTAYNTDRHTQNSIWSDFPYDQMQNDPTKWIYWFDDFTFVPSLTSATTAVNRWPYMSFIDTSDTIVALTTTKTIGVLRLTCAATDNNAPVITLPGDASVCFMLDDNTSADRRKFWMDFRWKKTEVTDNSSAVFIGICEEARAVNNGLLIDDTGVLADIDHIGFNVAHDNGEELNFAFTKAGQTDTELIANAATVALANSATTGLAADTYVKTGFKYDPAEVTAKRGKVYINNITSGTYVTGTQMAAATFPDGEEMVFAFGIKTGAGTSVTADLDWIRLAQKNLDV